MSAASPGPGGGAGTDDGAVAWVVLVRGEDRPGTLTAVTAVFSDRGVSFDSLATGGVDGDVGTIAVTFHATQRRQAVLVRTVARLAAVRDVAVRRADDPRVRAAGVLRMPPGATAPGGELPGLVWTGGREGGAVLVEGSLAGVAAVVRAARDAGATTWATVVLGI